MCAFRIPRAERIELLEQLAGWGALLAICRLSVYEGIADRGPELRIAPVAVDIANRPKALPHEIAERLMGLIPTAEAVDGVPIIPESAFNASLDLVPRLAEERRQAILARQRASRNALVAQQRETLDRHYGAKIDAARRRADSASNERIKRMHQGRLRNIRAERQDKLADLRADREPAAEIQPIAAAVFTPA